MKTLLWLPRLILAVGIGVLIYGLWVFDSAREAAKKRRLGPDYEGPLDNEDMQ